MSHDWTKFHLSDDEAQALVEKIASELDRALWQTAGEVLEGSVEEATRAGDVERRVKRIWDSLPKRVRDAYVQNRRKESADELRAKADKIERGEQV